MSDIIDWRHEVDYLGQYKIHGVGVGSLDDYGLTLFENGPTSHIAMVLSMHKVLICLTLLTHFSRQGCFYELFVFRFPQ